MRVKLSYTVDEKDVLEEAAKILNLARPDLQHAINLFNSIAEELVSGEDSAPVNTFKALEMIDEFRQVLIHLDTRSGEVVSIIEGYDEYVRGKAHASAVARSGPDVEDSSGERS